MLNPARVPTPEQTHGFDAAVLLALEAANRIDVGRCRTSRRGAVIWAPLRGVTMFATGTNARADGRECTESEACQKDCGRICYHAEQSALAEWSRRGLGALETTHLLHVKTVKGAAVPSGPPSCVECSKLLVRFGVGHVWLFQEEGWTHYDAWRFHEVTLKTLKLFPVGVEDTY